eukprot:3934486-Rhodomonas_salina.1
MDPKRRTRLTLAGHVTSWQNPSQMLFSTFSVQSLRACYSMFGTEVAYGASSARNGARAVVPVPCYLGGKTLRALYTMSGTWIACIAHRSECSMCHIQY